MEILGATLTAIAGEKAAIMKAGVPHLTGKLSGEARKVMRQVARITRVTLHSIENADVTFDNHRLRLSYISKSFSLLNYRPVLLGIHQLRNTALVLKACELLRTREFRLSITAIRRGIKQVTWPGRFQILRSPNGNRVLLDVGHNRGGAEAVARTFTICFPRKKATFILGLVKKKEHQQIIGALSRAAKEFILVPLPTHRSMLPDELIATLGFNGVPVRSAGSLGEALSIVASEACTADIIAVVGSHYLVGEYLEKYQKRWHGRRAQIQRASDG